MQGLLYKTRWRRRLSSLETWFGEGRKSWHLLPTPLPPAQRRPSLRNTTSRHDQHCTSSFLNFSPHLWYTTITTLFQHTWQTTTWLPFRPTFQSSERTVHPATEWVEKGKMQGSCMKGKNWFCKEVAFQEQSSDAPSLHPMSWLTTVWTSLSFFRCLHLLLFQRHFQLWDIKWYPRRENLSCFSRDKKGKDTS